MNRTKYNAKYSTGTQSSRHNSNIEKYLEKEINYLLNPSGDNFTQTEFSNIYVRNPEAEDALMQYTEHTQSNNTFILTGLTGSGKSMLIRYVFNIHSIKPHVSDDRKNIIIPFNFNNIPSGNIPVQFQRMMHSACDCLLEEFEGLRRVEENEEEFYSFIKERRADMIYVGDRYPQPSKREVLANICETMPLAFFSSMFKFYLNQREVCSIDNVIFVLDDIEGIRIDDMDDCGDRRRVELLPIKMVLELITCMENQNGEVVEWSLNTIISCRHYVYRLMHSVTYNVDRLYTQALEAYSLNSRYDLKKSPSIMDIINKRFTAVPAQHRDDKEKWEKAMGVVLELLDTIDAGVCQFVLDLRLKNIRETLSCLKELVFNKRWIQRECSEDVSGAFKIGDISQYKPTYASLIRAIGMNESNVYNSSNSLIPNLLYNGEHGELDLFPLLALKYALCRANYHESNWDDPPIKASIFYAEIDKLFNEKNITEKFQASFHYLIEHRLLLRNADQEQIDNDRLSRDNIQSVERVYVPGVAVTLWNMLGQSSVLFEMYVDDIWLDNSKRNYSSQFSRGFIDDKFELCLDYVEILSSIERELFLLAYNCTGNEVMYYKLFGKESISGYLLSGLEHSLNVFYRDNRVWTYRDSQKTDLWREKIKMLDSKCNKVLSV